MVLGPKLLCVSLTLALEARAVVAAGHQVCVWVLWGGAVSGGEWWLYPGLLVPTSASQHGGNASYLAGLKRGAAELVMPSLDERTCWVTSCSRELLWAFS